MRNSFLEKLTEFSVHNSKTFLVVADLGFSVIEGFIASCPNQFVNIGVAEQNMVGFAAGLASEGAKVFTYSIANFPTFRCAEQIRNDVVYHELDVTTVSVGAGLSYGPLGYSHHAIEDLCLMRSFYNMRVYTPSNIEMMKLQCLDIFSCHGPKYLRLSKDGYDQINVFDLDNNIVTWRANKSSRNAIIVCIGNTLQEGMGLSMQLGGAQVISPLYWNTSDDKYWIDKLIDFNNIYTLEDHKKNGGFGSHLLEQINAHPSWKGKVINLGYGNEIIGMVGNEKTIRKHVGFGQLTQQGS
jgi:transketolase